MEPGTVCLTTAVYNNLLERSLKLGEIERSRQEEIEQRKQEETDDTDAEPGYERAVIDPNYDANALNKKIKELEAYIKALEEKQKNLVYLTKESYNRLVDRSTKFSLIEKALRG